MCAYILSGWHGGGEEGDDRKEILEGVEESDDRQDALRHKGNVVRVKDNL